MSHIQTVGCMKGTGVQLNPSASAKTAFNTRTSANNC